MPTLQPFTRDRLIATPWKNGGGSTREIVRIPRNADLDTFDWRVSIAELSASGPFSAFPGVDRVIVLLSGAGVVMKSSAGEHRLNEPLIPFAFAGESQIDATLIGGASTDFNVMTRRATTSAEVHVITAADTIQAGSGVLFAARGAWSANDVRIEPGAGLWWDGDPIVWRLTPHDSDGALIAVRILRPQGTHL